MGQSTSVDIPTPVSTPTGSTGASRYSSILGNELDFLHDQIRKHSQTLRQLHLITREDLSSKIEELNQLSKGFVDCNGKQLLFEEKNEKKDGQQGTPPPHLLWKGLVRISCMKIDPQTQQVEKKRDLNLKQFLQVYNTITQMQGTIMQGFDDHDDVKEESEESNESGSSWDTSLGEEAAALKKAMPLRINQNKKKPVFTMSTSILLDEVVYKKNKGVDGDDNEEAYPECCICMDSKPEVSLPCAHSFCLPCIEQWNVGNKTCPMCREGLNSTDDTWVLEDKPDRKEVQMEMQKSLFNLTK